MRHEDSASTGLSRPQTTAAAASLRHRSDPVNTHRQRSAHSLSGVTGPQGAKPGASFAPSRCRPGRLVSALALALGLLLLGGPTLRAHESGADIGGDGDECDSQKEGCGDQGNVLSRPQFHEEVAVSANPVTVPREQVGTSMTLLDGDEIDRLGKRNVAELLRLIPGIEVTQTGGPGKVTSVRVRGGDASQALVLIDGQRVNSTTTGDYDLADLMAENIDRIEVLRGPQAVYGSEAVSGVISITTARGAGVGALGKVQLSAELGSLDLRDVRATAGGEAREIDWSASFSDLSTDGVSHLSGLPEPDGYDNRSVTGHLGWQFAAFGKLDLSLRAFEGDNELDGFFGDDLNALQERQATHASARLEWLATPSFRQQFTLGLSDDDLLGSDPDSPFNNFAIESQLSQIAGQSDWLFSAANTFSVGYSVERRQAKNVGSFRARETLSSFFAHDQMTFFERLHLSAAVRYDDHSRSGDETTYRLTAAWVIIEGKSRLHASVGSGFRAPDFNELFFPGAGNADLDPEVSSGFDLGFEQSWRRRRVVLDLTVFSYDFDNLIDFDLANFRFRNISAADSRGVEGWLRLELTDRFRLDLSHSYNEAKDRSTGQPLARRPKNRSVIRLLLSPSERIDAAITGVAVRDRSENNGTPMDDYEKVDLFVRYRLSRHFSVYARVDNLLDERYEEVPGFSTPERTFAAGLRVGL